jgi:hypothetical protein
MEHDEDLTTLPLVDDPTVKDVLAEFCGRLCTGRKGTWPLARPDAFCSS